MSRRALPDRSLPQQVSGVHEAPTRPAPYIDEPVQLGPLLGSIPIGALYIELQPILDLHGGETRGHEARLLCSAESLTDPGELFARAAFEKSVGELGRVMRSLAFECGEAARENARAGVSCLYMPLHPSELKDGLIVRPDDPLFEHSGRVRLQLSQPSFSTLAQHVLVELRNRSDVGLVLDDFGAGPSTLKHMLDLEPVAVKLDRELIAGLDKSPRKQAVVLALASLCDELQIELIAKGIDCKAELSAAIDCGVRLGQGFLLGEPVRV